MAKLFDLLIPGSILFFFLGLTIGFILLFRRKTNLTGKYLLGTIIFLYLLFSIPISADWLAFPLTNKYLPIKNSGSLPKAEALVLLDAGTVQVSDQGIRISSLNKTAALRLLELIRVYKLLYPQLVIISAGAGDESIGKQSNAKIYRDHLLLNGIPGDKIILDSISGNTQEHAVNVKRILKDKSIDQIILVTSPSHMPRSIQSFERVGIYPIASPSGGDLDDITGWRAYMPSTDTLEFTKGTFHEYIGIIYYTIKSYL